VDNIEVLEHVMELAMGKKGLGIRHAMPEGSSIRICREDDVGAMADIYREVFPSYPFPVHDPAYLRETMQSHVLYFGVESNGRLLALSSAELDSHGKNAEMTDFATLPASLGRGFAANLLAAMEPEAARHGIRTLYTIARAVSPGMNITFARLGYEFGGRLINNTQISGSIESMNVWYKQLPPLED
jgi:putative beta-lysine N-acetyltransferase